MIARSASKCDLRVCRGLVSPEVKVLSSKFLRVAEWTVREGERTVYLTLLRASLLRILVFPVSFRPIMQILACFYVWTVRRGAS